MMIGFVAAAVRVEVAKRGSLLGGVVTASSDKADPGRDDATDRAAVRRNELIGRRGGAVEHDDEQASALDAPAAALLAISPFTRVILFSLVDGVRVATPTESAKHDVPERGRERRDTVLTQHQFARDRSAPVVLGVRGEIGAEKRAAATKGITPDGSEMGAADAELRKRHAPHGNCFALVVPRRVCVPRQPPAGDA